MDFVFSGTPKIIFKNDGLKDLPKLELVKVSQTILFLTGKTLYEDSKTLKGIIENLKHGKTIHHSIVSGEPSPELVDRLTEKYKESAIDLVVSIGGGSVVDCGKAVSAMLTQDVSVMAFLEGVGEGRQHNGEKVPLIAIPTTSGTGSEMTKNAVLSEVGSRGFKKSLRHDNFIPDVAIMDPVLTASCPEHVTAASGMDALTQLMGAYVSTMSSPITDSLALSGIEAVASSLLLVCTTEGKNIELRGKMAYGAMISGIVLANAGLGVVHGFASSIGGLYPIPHGEICGTLLGESVRVNVNQMMKNREDYIEYLEKYARIGRILSMDPSLETKAACFALIEILDQWTEILNIKKLSDYGVKRGDLYDIARQTSNKYNPVMLTIDQKVEILGKRL